jgi:hypothetical protein
MVVLRVFPRAMQCACSGARCVFARPWRIYAGGDATVRGAGLPGVQKKVFIVCANPIGAASFSHAIADSAAKGLATAGHEVALRRRWGGAMIRVCSEMELRSMARQRCVVARNQQSVFLSPSTLRIRCVAGAAN